MMKNKKKEDTEENQETESQAVEQEKKENGEESKPSKNEVSAEEQIRELNDKYLRLYSEFDNYRKRTLKEKVELSKYAAAETVTKLLPVLDDFERAIKSFSSANGASEAIQEGVILIFNKFLSVLNQQGLEQMRTIGETFDTDFHEAVTNIPAPAPEQKGKVIDEIEKGYMLNGKVIRFAKVVVGS